MFSVAILAIGTGIGKVIAQTAITPSVKQTENSRDQILASKSESIEIEKESKPTRNYFDNEGHSGDQVAGDSRSECNPDETSLSSLSPKSSLSKTVRSHPEWWFYFPAKIMQTREIEFVLQDLEGNDVARESLSISHNSDYFNFQLPTKYSGLKPNSKYVWYLKLYCSPERNSVPLYVSGTVTRVLLQNKASSQEIVDSLTLTQYFEQNLWLDAVSMLFKNLTTVDDEIQRLHNWQNIVGSPTIDLKLDPPSIHYQDH